MITPGQNKLMLVICRTKHLTCIYLLELKFQALARIKIVQLINSQNACTNILGIFISMNFLCEGVAFQFLELFFFFYFAPNMQVCCAGPQNQNKNGDLIMTTNKN